MSPNYILASWCTTGGVDVALVNRLKPDYFVQDVNVSYQR